LASLAAIVKSTIKSSIVEATVVEATIIEATAIIKSTIIETAVVESTATAVVVASEEKSCAGWVSAFSSLQKKTLNTNKLKLKHEHIAPDGLDEEIQKQQYKKRQH